MTRTPAAVTVGVCTLDRPDALARCIDAIVAGTVVPAEIVVVDQGQIPANAIIAARVRHCSDLRHFPQQRRGLSAARNAVLAHARFPIVAVTDDDCVPDERWLATIVDAFARPPVPDAVTGRVLALPGDERTTYAISLRTDMTPADYTDLDLPWHIGTGANFAVRRTVASAAGGYDERLGAGSDGQAAEDLDLLLRLLRRGARVRYEPDTVIYHERQTRARRLATRWSYAYGIGALSGMYCRRADAFGIRMLAASFGESFGRLLRRTVALDTSGVHQAVLSIGGTVAGVGYGLRLGPSQRGVQVGDEHAAGL
jgi:glycosyltransferase involved in cell wall biosynthesis